MYYPLLRARQFELIALRDLANANLSQGSITPILEPVKESFNNLNIALTTFANTQQQAVMIVNPLVGDLSGDHEFFLEYLRGSNFAVRSAFYYHQG